MVSNGDGGTERREAKSGTLHNCVTLSRNQCSGRARRREFCKNCRQTGFQSDTPGVRARQQEISAARAPPRFYLYDRETAFILRVHPTFPPLAVLCGRPRALPPKLTFFPSFRFAAYLLFEF